MNREEFKSRSIGTNLVAGVDTIIYTCPTNFTAHVVLMFVCNKGSGNKTITAKWYNSHNGATIYLIGGYVISAYNFLKMDGSYLTMNAGDSIILTSEAGSDMDATVTVQEFYDPTRRE